MSEPTEGQQPEQHAATPEGSLVYAVVRCAVPACGHPLYAIDATTSCLFHDEDGRLRPLMCEVHWAKVPKAIKDRISAALEANEKAALNQALESAVVTLEAEGAAGACQCIGCRSSR